MDQFTLIADPTRRRILDQLMAGEADVTTLTETLALPQPLVSKHLRVLRDRGAVEASVAGNRRIYRLAPQSLDDVLRWATPYYHLWSGSFDRLAAELNEEDE
jgi:DNA-binding transcriptional ArsR family regulator